MRRNALSRLAFAISILAFTSACGGGGSGGGSSSGGTITPSPTPTATPSPSSTTFAAVAVGGFVTDVGFDANNDGLTSADPRTATALSGEFGRDVPVASLGQVFGTIPTGPTTRLEAVFGIDLTTGFVFSQLAAPRGATVVTPLTTLIDAQGSESAVRSALGLAAGADALSPGVNPLTFNPVPGRRSSDPAIVQDAARLTAVNIQLLALASVAKNTSGDPIDFNATLAESSRFLAEVITATGNGRLSDKAVVLAVLQKMRAAIGFPPAALDAVATLFAKYAAAMPTRIADDATARAWAYAFRFVIFADIRTLLSSYPNPAETRIAAITPADIQQSAQFFIAAPAPTIAPFVAVPSYLSLNRNSIPPYALTLTNCAPPGPLPSCNDYELFRGVSGTAKVVSVTTGNAAAIAVTVASDGTVALSRVGGFTGRTFFTYTARTSAGLEATGTTFVRVE